MPPSFQKNEHIMIEDHHDFLFPRQESESIDVNRGEQRYGGKRGGNLIVLVQVKSPKTAHS